MNNGKWTMNNGLTHYPFTIINSSLLYSNTYDFIR